MATSSTDGSYTDNLPFLNHHLHRNHVSVTTQPHPFWSADETSLSKMPPTTNLPPPPHRPPPSASLPPNSMMHQGIPPPRSQPPPVLPPNSSSTTPGTPASASNRLQPPTTSQPKPTTNGLAPEHQRTSSTSSNSSSDRGTTGGSVGLSGLDGLLTPKWDMDEKEAVKRRIYELKRTFHNGRYLIVRHLPKDTLEQNVRSLLSGVLIHSVQLTPSNPNMPSSSSTLNAHVLLAEPEVIENWSGKNSSSQQTGRGSSGSPSGSHPRIPSSLTYKGHQINISPSSTENLLCVTCLPLDTSEEEFAQLVTAFGSVSYCFLMRSERTGASKGYGFVCYGNRDVALQARSLLDQRPHHDSMLGCDWLEPNIVTFSSLHSCCVLVDGLPKDYRELGEFRKTFSQVANPPYCQIALSNGAVQQWGLVEYGSPCDAEDSVAALQGHVVRGHPLRIRYCTPGKRAINLYNKLLNDMKAGANSGGALLPQPPVTKVVTQLTNLAKSNPAFAESLRNIVMMQIQNLQDSASLAGTAPPGSTSAPSHPTGPPPPHHVPPPPPTHLPPPPHHIPPPPAHHLFQMMHPTHMPPPPPPPPIRIPHPPPTPQQQHHHHHLQQQQINPFSVLPPGAIYTHLPPTSMAAAVAAANSSSNSINITSNNIPQSNHLQQHQIAQGTNLTSNSNPTPPSPTPAPQQQPLDDNVRALLAFFVSAITQPSAGANNTINNLLSNQQLISSLTSLINQGGSSGDAGSGGGKQQQSAAPTTAVQNGLPKGPLLPTPPPSNSSSKNNSNGDTSGTKTGDSCPPPSIPTSSSANSSTSNSLASSANSFLPVSSSANHSNGGGTHAASINPLLSGLLDTVVVSLNSNGGAVSNGTHGNDLQCASGQVSKEGFDSILNDTANLHRLLGVLNPSVSAGGVSSNYGGGAHSLSNGLVGPSPNGLAGAAPNGLSGSLPNLAAASMANGLSSMTNFNPLAHGQSLGMLPSHMGSMPNLAALGGSLQNIPQLDIFGLPTQPHHHQLLQQHALYQAPPPPAQSPHSTTMSMLLNAANSSKQQQHQQQQQPTLPQPHELLFQAPGMPPSFDPSSFLLTALPPPPSHSQMYAAAQPPSSTLQAQSLTAQGGIHRMISPTMYQLSPSKAAAAAAAAAYAQYQSQPPYSPNNPFSTFQAGGASPGALVSSASLSNFMNTSMAAVGHHSNPVYTNATTTAGGMIYNTPTKRKSIGGRMLPSPEPSPEGGYIGQHSQGIGGHYQSSYLSRKRSRRN